MNNENQVKYGDNLKVFFEEFNAKKSSSAKKKQKKENDAGYGVGKLSKGALAVLSKAFGGSGVIDSASASSGYGANMKDFQGGNK